MTIFFLIVLFTYNRPDQTAKTLAENVLADNYPNIIDTFAKKYDFISEHENNQRDNSLQRFFLS